jgi:hypothetical protein
MTRPMLLRAAAAMCLSLGLVGSAMADQPRFNSLANLPFKEGRPTPKTAKTLKEKLLFQRASQIYLWALPVINLYGMKEGSEAKFGAGYNVLPVFKKRLNAKTLTTGTLTKRTRRNLFGGDNKFNPALEFPDETFV